ncbi:MAG: DNA polymerase/3'-5' exonuclease PolX, partial [Candidatus Spechtbacterales bacterium]|nr:DNA polymerase/3'-5' exonuclease PolX [Candidatus Spechtbacterales bacterium]
MPSRVNQELTRIFEEMGLMYEMSDDKFRQRAYHRAAYTLSGTPEDIEQIYKEDGIAGLKNLSGIGEGMALKIEEYLKKGEIEEYEEMKKKIPVQIQELASVEGVGPKAIHKFYKELGVKNLEDLEKVAKEGRIKELSGYGKKTEENILQGIKFVKDNSGRSLLGDALPYALDLVKEIKDLEGVEKVSEAGSIRRRQETIGDVDILVAAKDAEGIFDYVEKQNEVIKVMGRGKTKLSVHLKQGFDIDVRVVPIESWGAALQYFTGSKEHNVKVRQIAIERGFKLNEYGLFKGEKNITANQSEKEIYEKLGMDFPSPELRQDKGEIKRAQENELPELIEYGSLRGDMQLQTKNTDGKHSIEEMAIAAKEFGLDYIAITDHTKGLAMTGGLDEDGLLKQKENIEKINNKIDGITILSGAEVNIQKDGSLDIEDEALSELDVVGISIHSYFNLSKEEQTKRVVEAMRNPHADIFFHPTGRRINRRPPVELDMEKIIEVAKETGTILEINAHPERLDLLDEHIRMAVDAGVKMCINSDAHSKYGYKYLKYGIAQARR